MAGQLRASIIIDLMGNIAQRSRQFAGNISTMARSSQTAMRGLRTSVVSVSSSIDRLGSSATRTFGMLAAGGATVAGLGYTANKLFISIASTRENQRIAMNSLYKGNQQHATEMMQWAIQNAKDSTWGLTGVMQEFISSKAFGMSDGETKNFITMLQDQGALKGWDLSAAQGASLQLKQMFSRQQITAADANLLTGYGINVYQVLADRWNKDIKEVRKAGEKGQLGIKSIIQLFQALQEESKGAQKNAMNSWTGLTAQMGDVWEDFADKLMNKGPFERLKGQLRDVLGWYDRISKPGVNGVSELDQLTDNLAGKFNSAFISIKRAADQAWRVLQMGKNALSWVDENIVSLKTMAKVIGGIWLANKALRIGGAIMRPTWQVATSPYRAYRWMRGRNQPGVPGMPPVLSNPALIQQVFVTNWPGSFGGGGDVYAGNGKRKRGPGRGRGKTVPVVPSAAPAAAKAGLFSRIFSGAGSMLSGARSAIKGAGNWLAGSAIGRVVAKGSQALGWLGRGAGKVFSRLGGPLMAGAMMVPTLMDETASTEEKGSAVGGTAGAWAGGAVGSLLGPLGTVAGATLGGVLGDYLGGWLGNVYNEFTAKNDNPEQQTPPPEQKVSAQAQLKIQLADGLQITSTNIQEDGMGMNVWTGQNLYPY
ncbi:TPA: tape measure protein [Citrobacter freundii]|uniref:tape measure protein n=1 Tax=Citrobacter freundii TaxID=546 RepID=UPI00168AEEF9|nr:tape measure protein [Citrobacter freundii]EJR7284419.1 tape measure protein [Citrobacter freundii]EKT9243972.1 tape measure protein [Citrobacter freundii]QND11546.1 tape measure protein [Citrobacter freundii]HAU4412768.1 tape measure protein [Citrobacter freundii]HAU4466249.1 tape measure protein [Citrobacter freundii]